MKVNNICGKCGEQNILTAKDIVRETVYDDKGNKLFLTCYYCKSCRLLRVLQIDNEESKETLQLIRELTCNVIDRKNKGLKIRNKQIKRREELQKKLLRIRKQANETYTGKHVKNEKFDIYNLTIDREGDIICL